MLNLGDTYWYRVVGYVSELRVDARWILKNRTDDKPYGSLRIVSHPDLKPGYLRAIFTYVDDVRKKTRVEKIKTVEDYSIEPDELEVYSIDDEIKTQNTTYEAPYKELNELFGVKIFD